MTMKMTTALGALLLLSFAATGRSYAACSAELEVTGTEGATTIRIYDEAGKRIGEVDKALAVKQRAQDCDESLGLVKITLTDSRVVWVNRSEAKRISGVANAPVCVVAPGSDPSQVVAASNGVDPSQVKCVPASNR